MPSLHRNPDDYLLDGLARQSAQVREVSTIRRSNTHNFFGLVNNNQVIPATTFTKVVGYTTYYTSPAAAWNGTDNTYTPEESGIYMVVANINWALATTQLSATYITEDPTGASFLAGSGWNQVAGTGYTTAMTTITQFDGGSPYALWIYMYGAGGTIQGGASTLQIHRMGDVPDAHV